jgi:hypothetical protein
MTSPTLGRPYGYQPITIPQGADFRMSLLLIYRDESGAAVIHDTTGWDVLLQVRKEPTAESPVLMEASTANGRVTVGIQGTAPYQANVVIKVAASVTAGLADWGEGGYDLNCRYPNLDVDIHLTGPARLKRAYAWRS